MARNQNEVVVGIFEQFVQASNIVKELRRAGYRDEEICFLAHASMSETEDGKVVNVTTSAVGGVLGGLLGAVGAPLMPGVGSAIEGSILLSALGVAIVGALVGNIVGTLTDIGNAEQQACYYQHEREKGRTIVLVKSPVDHERILTIMNRHGALTCQYWAG